MFIAIFVKTSWLSSQIGSPNNFWKNKFINLWATSEFMEPIFLYYLYINQSNIMLGSTWHRVNDYILCLYLHHQMMQFSHKLFKCSFKCLFHYVTCAISITFYFNESLLHLPKYVRFPITNGSTTIRVQFIHLIIRFSSRENWTKQVIRWMC